MKKSLSTIKNLIYTWNLVNFKNFFASLNSFYIEYLNSINRKTNLKSILLKNYINIKLDFTFSMALFSAQQSFELS